MPEVLMPDTREAAPDTGAYVAPTVVGVIDAQYAASGHVESVDARTLSYIRCAIALAGLLIVYVSPVEPQRLVNVTYTSLASYLFYSIAIAFITIWQRWTIPPKTLHWLDIGFFAFLTSLTDGTNSIFFPSFFFPILVSSFCYGFREGFVVCSTAIGCYLSVAIFVGPTSGEQIELDRTLIRPVYLVTLGYLIVYWGAAEMLLKRRLLFLYIITSFRHPRFGLAHAIETNLHRFCEFYAARLCVLALRNTRKSEGCTAYVSTGSASGSPGASMQPDGELADLLLGLPERQIIAYAGESSMLKKPYCVELDPLTGESRKGAPVERLTKIANLLDARYLVTVPFYQRDLPQGRLYLAGDETDFTISDTRFLVQAVDALSLTIENVELMEEMVEKASHRERQRISRDIHDSSVQPYIALRVALEALHRDAQVTPSVARKLQELIDMASLAVTDLRNHIAELRGGTGMPGALAAASIREQSERYGRFYGIHVEIRTEAVLGLSDALAAETYQIVLEALSNVRKHTHAKKAFVHVSSAENMVVVEVGNEAMAPETFVPRSIRERALALGGRVRVEHSEQRYTVVRVELPL